MSTPAQPRHGPPPRHVLATADEADAVLARLARDGWHTRPGFALPDPPGPLRGVVLFGPVTDAVTAAAAVAAAARGAGVVAVADPYGDLGRALCVELAATPDGPEPRGGPLALPPEQRALLRRLAEGQTIAAAAAAEYLSLRTANRRIAQIRARLGVATTREAVLAFLRQQQDGPH